MIRVKLADAIIKVGGDFQIQKDRIKGSGARWNPTTKVWESRKPLKDWHITPYDIEKGVESGDHVTRYGTHYSQPEWSYLQGIHRVKSKIDTQFQPRREALKQELLERLISIGLTPDAVNHVARIIQRGDLEYDVETGHIQFSTVDRAQQIRAIEAWYGEAIEKLTMDEIDAQNAAEERLADTLGLE